MILNLFLYFARFVGSGGVASQFSNGSSSLDYYAQLLNCVKNLGPALIPDIKNMVFGPSLDSLKSYVDGIEGVYMIIDYGEIKSLLDRKNSFSDSQELAITIAMKTSSLDLAEAAIISDLTLRLLSVLRKRMYEDSINSVSSLFEKESFESSRFVPFVGQPLSSMGWTMLINTSSSDFLQSKKHQ